VRHDDTGASAAEYGLLIAGIAALLVVVLFALGGTVSRLFDRSCESVRAKAAPTETC
jgi:pilus assembly protein Flp/PilA